MGGPERPRHGAGTHSRRERALSGSTPGLCPQSQVALLPGLPPPGLRQKRIGAEKEARWRSCHQMESEVKLNTKFKALRNGESGHL